MDAEKMIKFFLLTVSAMLMGAALCGAQQAIASEETHSDIAHHGGRPTQGLAARSEMQQPKPIPVVNSLRFPEIPVADCIDNTRLVPGASTTQIRDVSNDVQTYSWIQPSGCAVNSTAAALGTR